MKKLIIIGARFDGHAKVVLELAKSTGDFDVVGFLDDDTQKHGSYIHDIPVLGSIDLVKPLVAEGKVNCFTVALGNNRLRREIGLKLMAIIPAINIIHPTAIIDPSVSLGVGNVVMQGAVLVADTQIGNFVNIHALCSVDHDNILEDGANLAPGTHTAGRVKIGMDAFLGTGCSVIPDISIGKGCIVGAGSVVIRNLRNFVTAVGNPAQVIKDLETY